MPEETKFDYKELVEKINTEIKILEENQEFLGDYAIATIEILRQINDNINGKKIEYSNYLKLTFVLFDIDYETQSRLGFIEEEEIEEEEEE